MDNLKEFLAFAYILADASGAIIRPYFGQPLAVETKPDVSPVSIADREAEAAIRTLIESTYPDHGIYGEEHGSAALEKRYVWVIDPIDGTRAFLAGKREWGTLIALCEDGVPILGILDQPVTGERWVGLRGERARFYQRPSSASWNPSSYATGEKVDSGLRRNDDVLKVKANVALAEAEISTTSRDHFAPRQAGAFMALADRCAAMIQDGDCYAYGMLARGERNLVVDADLKPYDILALIPIIEGAGGVITGWDGAPITLSHYNTALAAGDPALHKEALAILSKSV